MDAHGQSWIGRVLKGRYRVEAALGAGGMGVVYRAADLELGEVPVVVKHPLRPVGGAHSDTQDKELRKRFVAEVSKLIALEDVPGVVRIRGQGVEDGTPFYVMDFMAAGSLDDRLRRRRDSPMEVLRWAEEVAATLDEIHSRGLVHRDIKPQNLLFQREGGRALIGDFGIVKELAAEWGTTGPVNTQIGTPGFMAPEQYLPDTAVDGRCDQFALAATMYVALAGKPLTYEATGGSPAQMPGSVPPSRKAIRRVDAPDMAPHVPSGAAGAIARGLEREPDDRFDTCRALVEAYAAGLSQGSGVPGTATVRRPAGYDRVEDGPVPRRGAGDARRSRMPMLLGALVLLAGAFFGLKALGGIGGGAGERASSQERAGGERAPTTPVANPGTPGPPQTPARQPTSPPTPTFAYEAPLARARAAMAEGDGARAKAALAEAVAANAPHGLTAEVEAFVAVWEAAPSLTIASPTNDAEIEAEAGKGWTIAVRGTLRTGRKGDRLCLEDRVIARDASGAFAFTTWRPTAGAVTLTLEVRDGTTLRGSGSVAVRLKEKASPPTPAPPAIPSWARVSPEQTAEAQRLGVDVAFEEPTTGIRFVLIPGGSLNMGTPELDGRAQADERPPHSVRVSSFYLSVTEVTNAQYRTYEGEHAPGTPANNPVVNVSWASSTRFAQWLSERTAATGARLPTEAEWEHACRAGTTTAFAFGDGFTDEQANFAERGTTPVGAYEPNRWGLHDMHGNVWEWCADDYHATYSGAPTDGSAWTDTPRASTRVARGGGWRGPVSTLRSAYRAGVEPGLRNGDLGFRLARSLPPPAPAPVPAAEPTSPAAQPNPAPNTPKQMERVSLMAPGDGSTWPAAGGAPVFQWLSVEGAKDYELEIWTRKKSDIWVPALTDGVHGTTRRPSSMARGQYRWHVRARSGQGALPGPWSEWRGFTID